jgi:DNA invertase Pin-like site-specific DNA recombinase
VIYARVSTDKREQATSIANQVSSCRKYCQEQGWDVVDEFTDTASGSSFDRPGWKRLLALVESGEVGRIVVTTRDRISRNALGYGLLKRDSLEVLNVTIDPIMGMASQPHQDDGLADPDVELAEDMEMVIAQHTRRLIRWKTIQGMRRQAEQGVYLGKPPYGTVKGPEKGVPIQDPTTWPIVEKMFRLSACGYTYSEICEHLNSSGVPSHKGAKWDHSSVRLIVANRFYLGERMIKGQVYAQRHQCRIDADLWERAQKPVSPSRRGGRKPVEYVYLLPRVVASNYRVAYPKRNSGQPLELRPKFTYGRHGSKNHYYYRADRLRKHGGIQTEHEGADFLRPGSRAEDLDEAVLKELISLAMSRGHLHWCSIRGTLLNRQTEH